MDSRLRGNDGGESGNDGGESGNDGGESGNDGGESGNDGQGLRINMLMRKPWGFRSCGACAQFQILYRQALWVLLVWFTIITCLRRLLGHATPVNAMKKWHTEKPELFILRPCNRPGPNR